jgi:hypothetical protein
MIFVTSISAILTLFLGVWCLLMSRRPKFWRLWWMSHLHQIDLHSTSEERRQQDGVFRIMVTVACLLCAIATVWGVSSTWTQWSETRRPARVNEGKFLEQDAATVKAQAARQ